MSTLLTNDQVLESSNVEEDTSKGSQEKKDPKRLQTHWQDEIDQGLRNVSRWHKEGDKILTRFRDERRNELDGFGPLNKKLNLYHANIITLMSMLYGRIPKVEVTRRHADADDDAARVAGVILTRILNMDIEVAGEDAASVFRNGLQDRLIPGFGTARVQYDCTIEEQETPAITDPTTGQELAPAVKKEAITSCWVDIVYTHWQDEIWSPARIHSEIRWKAFRSYLTKTAFKKRFPKADLDKVTFATRKKMETQDKENQDTVLPQAEVWEIWDKESKCVYWYTQGVDEILGHEDDPLGLDGFFPDPPPMIANSTTSLYMPKSDFMLAQDLYQEIDVLETRIALLTEACKCVGVYDKANDGVQRVFTEGVENQLIPVENWGQFSEKGGLAGVIDWVPIEDVANTIKILTEKQSEQIQKLYQVTGMNDVMRGAAQAGSERVSATQRKLEANYGSIRIEALQNEFSRWVSDLQTLKAEIISLHYPPEEIIKQSNILATPDAQWAQQAVELIKNPESAVWRIIVRPETLAIADYAQLKQDRVEYINALALFMQSAAPLLEMDPSSLPFLLKLLKWGMAGFKGSSEIEGVMDQFITQVEKQPPGQKQDPAAQKAQAEVQKLQMEMQMKQQEFSAKMEMEQQKNQLQMQKIQMELAAKQQEMQMKLQAQQMEYQMKNNQIIQEHGMEMQKMRAELAMQQKEQAAQFAFNTAEREYENRLQVRSGEQQLRQSRAEGKLKIQQQRAQQRAKPKKPSGNG